jgi:ribose transport system permease protein
MNATSSAWRATLRHSWRRLQDVELLLPVVAVSLLFYSLNPAMFAPATVRSVLFAASYPALAGLGLALLMIAGEIDLSTGPVMGVCAIAAGWLMRYVGWPAWAGAAGGLTVALLVGLINGLLTVKLGAPSLVATLAVGITIRGASYMFTAGIPIYPLAPEMAALSEWRFLGLPAIALLMLAVLVIVQVVLRQTRWGSAIYATGGNRVAAEQCGIDADLVKVACFMLTSLLAGGAGLMVMSQIRAADPIIGRSFEMYILIGVVLGGVSFYGGRGSPFNTVLGALLVQIVKTGLILAHINPAWFVLILGVVLAVAAGMGTLQHRRRI